MESIISAIVGFIAGCGVTFPITVKLMSKKMASSNGRITEQSRIKAGGDVAGGDIKK